MSDAVTYTCDNHIAVITMNKADRMNRLDPEIVDGLNQCWKRFMADDDARVAVLTGSGEKAFSAGADLKNVPHDLYRAIPSIGVPVDKPVIGAVAGWCIGGGMVLTTMCDILICADNTTFSYPEVKIAFSGGLISNLASRIPHKLAMELLLVGDNMSVQRAYEVGYVNKIVPVAELMPTAMEWAGKIADTAPMPSRMLKRFVLDTMPKGPTEQAAIARVQVEAINDSSDWVEGQAAFAEKRKPNYHGR
ncbi:MAG: enoyl-CoA hydratase [Hyphomicrobiaceae bacterium TMED74]|nr:enoyl-CoA hydratase [Filomicrobium sp.]RPG39930.1 MAG: enoyl-CoA hydratase [Hyphomicrobiaceae bacterium TMED74]